MLINKLILRNFKVYGDTDCVIEFKRGINLIHGDNGSGKTSIIEGIAYALFGENVIEHTSDLIREGHNQAEVKLTFTIQTKDRQTCRYRIERVIKKRGTVVKIFDDLIGLEITDKFQDINQWILSCLDVGGLGFGDDYSDDDEGNQTENYIKFLYQSVVCVSQGEMTTLFLDKNKRIRTKTFATLLKADELQLAQKKLGEVKSKLKVLKEGKDHELDLLKKDIENLRNAETNLSKLTEQLQSSDQDARERNNRLTDLKAERNHFSALLQRMNEIAGNISTLDSNIQIAQSNLNNIQDNLDRAEEAERVIVNAQKGYQAYLDAVAQQAHLSTQKDARDSIKYQIHDIGNRSASNQAFLAKCEEKLKEITDAEVRILELQPQANKQKELEAIIDKLKLTTAAYSEVQSRLKERQTTLADIQAKRAKTSDESEKRSKLESEYNNSQEDLEKVNQRIIELDERLIFLRERERNVSGNINSLDQQLQKSAILRKQLENEELQLSLDINTLNRYRNELTERGKKEGAISLGENERGGLTRETAIISSRLTSIEKEIIESKKHVEILSEAHQSCPVCRKPLTDAEAAELKAKTQETIRDLYNQQAQLASRQEEITTRLSEIEKEITDNRRALSQLANEAMINELALTIDKRKSFIQGLKNEIGEDDILRLDLTVAQAESDEIHTQIQSLDDEKAGKVKEVQQKGKAQQKLHESFQKLATIGQVEELDRSISSIQQNIADDESRLKELENQAKEKGKKQGELDALGDPVHEIFLLQQQVSRRTSVEEEQSRLLEQNKAFQQQIDDVKRSLKPYESLDEQIRQNNEAINLNASDYEQYLSHNQAAESAENLRKQDGEAKLLLQGLLKSRREFQNSYDEQNGLFDQPRFKELSGLIEEQEKALTIIKTQQKMWLDQINENRDKIDLLNEYLGKQGEMQCEINRLQKQVDILTFLVESIKKACPRILEKRRNVISQQATEYLRRILRNDYVHLEITDDYAVQVLFNKDTSKSSSARPFRQLSGGEQMAVALAVRMAILSCMSNLRLIFLDEPTANLDSTRREGLASSISELENIEALHQIFVITHDDSFTHFNPHRIHISKRNEQSQVEIVD